MSSRVKNVPPTYINGGYNTGTLPWSSGRGNAVSIGKVSLSLGSASFSRSTEAARYDGATNSLVWESAGTLRHSDRGDSGGSLLYLEGPRKNYVDDITFDSWLTASAAVITADQAIAPDNSSEGDQIDFDAVDSSRVYDGHDLSGGTTDVVLSVWVKRNSGTGDVRPSLVATPDGFVSSDQTPLADWTRMIVDYSTVATDTGVLSTIYNGTGGNAHSIFAWGLVTERGSFPSSPMRGLNFTRAADSLVWAPVDVPSSLYSSAWKSSQVRPDFAAADLSSGDEYWLFSIDGASNGIRIYHDGVDVRVQAVEAGVVRAESQALVHSRGGLLGEVEWDPSAGTVSVGGVVGPAGSSWSWPAASSGIRLGGIYGGSGELFGEMATLERV